MIQTIQCNYREVNHFRYSWRQLISNEAINSRTRL